MASLSWCLSAPPSMDDLILTSQECRSSGNLSDARRVYMQVCSKGMEFLPHLGTFLIPMFIECGSTHDAVHVFHKLNEIKELQWTSLIQGFAQLGDLHASCTMFKNMLDDEKVDYSSNSTLFCLLKACSRLKCLEKGREIHREIIVEGFEIDIYVVSTLMDLYGKCGCFEEAQEVFDELPDRNVVSWNVLIGSCLEFELSREALNCIELMYLEGISPNEVTLFYSMKGCSKVLDVSKGKELHREAIKKGYENDPLISNGLVDMYAKFGFFEEAWEVLIELQVQDVASWTSLLAGYVEHGHHEYVLHFLEEMRRRGISPDAFTYVCVLRACGNIGEIAKGHEVHGLILKLALEKNAFVCSSLVEMYGNLGLIPESHQILNKLQIRDVVSWNTLIGSYVDQGLCEDALKCFETMQIKGVSSDAVTYVCCLQACIHIDSIRRGQELHSEILQKGFEGNPKVGNTLVDMYAKYGQIAEAQRVFDTLSRKDVVTWTALMAGYNENRDMEQTLHCFDHMLLNGVSPNVVSWNTLIECYADKGDLEKATELYQQMQEQGLIPNEVTFSSIVRGCGNMSLAFQTGQKVHAQVLGVGKVEGSMGRALVDMYGKFGSMIDAENVFNALQIKNCFAWTALVMGYARKGEVKLLFESLEEMNRAGIEPDEITFISILTVCTHTGLLNVGQIYFEVMNSKFGISPNIEHYNCMVDLLSRSGKVAEAVALLEKLEIGPDFVMWNTMLGACRHTLGHSEVGRFAFELSVELNEEHSAAYALMLNTLMWEDA